MKKFEKKTKWIKLEKKPILRFIRTRLWLVKTKLTEERNGVECQSTWHTRRRDLTNNMFQQDVTCKLKTVKNLLLPSL